MMAVNFRAIDMPSKYHLKARNASGNWSLATMDKRCSGGAGEIQITAAGTIV